MEDSMFSFNKFMSLALWGLTLGVLMLAWIALAFGHDGLLHAFGYTACVSSAVAAVAQLRRYNLAVCAVVKSQAAMARHAVSESVADVRHLR